MLKFSLLFFSGQENWQEKEDECQVLQLESLLERVLCFPYWWNGYETSLLGCNGMYLKVEISRISKRFLNFEVRINQKYLKMKQYFLEFEVEHRISNVSKNFNEGTGCEMAKTLIFFKVYSKILRCNNFDLKYVFST